MKDYTYQDLVKMQEDAVKRVQEMQKRSKAFVEDLNNSSGKSTRVEKPIVNESLSGRQPVRQVKAIRLPVDFGEAENTTERQSFFEQPPVKKTQQKFDLSTALNGIFGNLSGDDTERMLLLALCLLLSSEDADEPLIMAMMYLLS